MPGLAWDVTRLHALLDQAHAWLDRWSSERFEAEVGAPGPAPC